MKTGLELGRWLQTTAAPHPSRGVLQPKCIRKSGVKSCKSIISAAFKVTLRGAECIPTGGWVQASWMYDDGDRNSGEVTHDRGYSYRKPKGTWQRKRRRELSTEPFRGFNVTSRTQANNFLALSYEMTAPLLASSLIVQLWWQTLPGESQGITTKLWSRWKTNGSAPQNSQSLTSNGRMKAKGAREIHVHSCHIAVTKPRAGSGGCGITSADAEWFLNDSLGMEGREASLHDQRWWSPPGGVLRGCLAFLKNSRRLCGPHWEDLVQGQGLH